MPTKTEVANNVMYDAFERILDDNPYSHALQAVLTAIVADDDKPKVAKLGFGAADDRDGEKVRLLRNKAGECWVIYDEPDEHQRAMPVARLLAPSPRNVLKYVGAPQPIARLESPGDWWLEFSWRSIAKFEKDDETAWVRDALRSLVGR